MKKSDARKWANALWSGKYEKLLGRMSNGCRDKEPTACCCLGVANELFKPKNYKGDRLSGIALDLKREGVLNTADPSIFDYNASLLNDGSRSSFGKACLVGIPKKGLSHKEIALLLDLAIESGEYVNI